MFFSCVNKVLLKKVFIFVGITFFSGTWQVLFELFAVIWYKKKEELNENCWKLEGVKKTNNSVYLFNKSPGIKNVTVLN